MIVRIAELEIDPGRIDAYAALLKDEIETSLAVEPGVVFLMAVSIRGRPECIRILEGYADQAAYEAHLRTPHFLRYKSETDSMVRSLRLIEADPVALAAKGGLLA